MPSKIPIQFVDGDDSSPWEKPALERADSAPAAEDVAKQDMIHQVGEEDKSLCGSLRGADSNAVASAAWPADATLEKVNLEEAEIWLDTESFDGEFDAVEPGEDIQEMAARLERVETELTMVDAERQELCERITRVQADFDNFRKRMERERARSFQSLVGDVARNLLPVLDNLQRAVEAESSLQASESEEFRHFLHGVELIHRQLGDVLENLGLKPVETTGLPFDPHVHEAVATQFSEAHAPDTVLQEIVRGYHIGDTLLRPAMVKVSVK